MESCRAGFGEAGEVVEDQRYRAPPEGASFDLRGIRQIDTEAGDDEFTVTPEGRLLLRAIAMVFDEYLQEPQIKPKFSRVI